MTVMEVIVARTIVNVYASIVRILAVWKDFRANSPAMLGVLSKQDAIAQQPALVTMEILKLPIS